MKSRWLANVALGRLFRAEGSCKCIQLMFLCLRPLIYEEHTKTEDISQLIECLPGINAALGLILLTESVISSPRRGDRRTRSSRQAWDTLD